MPLRPTLRAALLTLALAPALAQSATTPPTACTDFYTHVNGPWLAQNPLPAGATRLSRWDQLIALGQSQRDQVINATTAPADAVVSQRLADLFASAQDEAAIEAAGTTALKPLLAIVDRIRRTKDVGPAIIALHEAGMPVLVDLQVLRDGNGNPYAQIGPGGIGLPDAAFYTANDAEAVTVRNKYGAALAEWLRLTGTPQDKLVEHTTWVAAIELQLAQANRAGTPFAVLPLAEAQRIAGQFDLGDLLAAHDLKSEQVALSGSQFLLTVNRLIGEMKPEQWKVYLRAQIARDMAPALPKAFRDPWIGLYDETLAGADQSTPRVVRARQLLEARVPEFLDGAYMERFLPAARQKRGQEIAENVRQAALAAVERATWLSADGKAQAKARLTAMQIQVGRELPVNVFAELRFNRADLAGNVLQLRRWLMKYALVRAYFAWPAEQWQPLVVYMPQENRLVATAAALQPPVLDDSGSAAGYGSFGALVAQQMMLGTQQALTGADATAWGQRATPLLAQYNAYSAAGGPTKVNGTRSFVQNQADLAGVEIAWAALNASGAQDAAAHQAFFAGWAAMWARRDAPQALATAQATDQHAPAKWRVNGPLANLPAFATAYSCRAGQAMVRPAAQQVGLWR